MKNKALFLDRDGVINKEINYLYKIDDFVFNKGIFRICKHFSLNGYKIIIITNQAGIARGYYDIDDFKILNNWMIKQFLKEKLKLMQFIFVHIILILLGNCRKPNPGMIFKAQKEYNIDLSKSILIGDKKSDISAGENAGIKINLKIKKNNLTSIFEKYKI